MRIFNHNTNGIIFILIAILHTQFCLSTDGYGTKFIEFADSYFFQISNGADEFPTNSLTDFEAHASFWFFYFGIFIIPIGLLVRSIEKNNNRLPLSFTISYLIVIIVGSYMIPKSGMTYFMLPHALFMFVQSIYKHKQSIKSTTNE